MIRYYSTNRNISGLSGIKPFSKLVSFREALLMGQAPDEGLFMPDSIPNLDLREVMRLKGKPYTEAALAVLYAFLEDEISRDVLRDAVEDAYNFPVPLEKVSEKVFIMRLDQGPTASFKDFAARMMARLMSIFRGGEERLRVLVATSGDTGSAVGEAYKGVPGIDVMILYPQKEVSLRQKRQLDGIGGNVRAVAVDGKFDDCQNLVKEAFGDPSLTFLNLTSANSINVGRILPQIIYYVYAYAQLASEGEEIIFSVPSGNFGNALGCELARRMGVPIRKLIMPTNENDEFPRYLKTGVYEKVSPSKSCISSAMNVGHPSNLARFFDLYGGTIDRNGRVYRYPNRDEMRKYIYSVSVSDEETKRTIIEVFNKYGVLLEPHGAVGWRGLEFYLEDTGDDALAVVLETAHPAKFPEVIRELLGFDPEMPPSLKGIDERQGECFHIPADYRAFKDFLLTFGVSGGCLST
ncbi:MAG: threonine synthase [Syntrophales bacterium]|nr:threonine synthase [Syntrophales bacterium]